MVDKPMPSPVSAARNVAGDMTSLLSGVLARYSAVPLPSGDKATLDAYLSRLIRCASLCSTMQLVNPPDHMIITGSSAGLKWCFLPALTEPP